MIRFYYMNNAVWSRTQPISTDASSDVMRSNIIENIFAPCTLRSMLNTNFHTFVDFYFRVRWCNLHDSMENSNTQYNETNCVRSFRVRRIVCALDESMNSIPNGIWNSVFFSPFGRYNSRQCSQFYTLGIDSMFPCEMLVHCSTSFHCCCQNTINFQ